MIKFVDKQASNIIVNLWANKDRELDTTLDNNCKHLNVENQVCTSCGSFVGYWGHEKSILQFYKHTLQFVYNQKCDVHIVHHKPIPNELVLGDFSISKTASNPYRSITHIDDNHMIISSFYKNPMYTKYNHAKKGSVIEWLIKNVINSGSVFLNPTKIEHGYPIKYSHINKGINNDKWHNIFTG